MANASDFPTWLQNQLDDRNWKQADFARRTGVNSGYVSQIMNGVRSPGVEFCQKVARAFGIRDVDVMKIAGLAASPAQDDATPSLRELITKFAQLSDEDQESVLKHVRALDEMQQAEKRRTLKLKTKSE